MAKKIVVDPFFDGAAVDDVEDVPAEYAPIESTDLGRRLPAGPDGLRGTIIPKAPPGPGGAPSGGQGTGQGRTEIHVDPDIPGQSTVVYVEDLKAEKVAQAYEDTKNVDSRIRASAIYSALAKPTQGKPVASPLKAFNAIEQPDPPAAVEQIPAKMDISAPTRWVTFEIEGFGEHRAPYHRVIRNESTLVLVYDTRCAGAQRFFPRTTDKPLGIYVDGESLAYYAHTTGIEFSDGNIDYCVLLIEREAPLTTAQNNEEYAL